MIATTIPRPLMACACAAALFANAAFASDAGQLTKDKADKVHASKPLYSPYAGRSFPTRPYFGDTHLHTGFSMDAGAFGARVVHSANKTSTQHRLYQQDNASKSGIFVRQCGGGGAGGRFVRGANQLWRWFCSRSEQRLG